jgi:hypothetical protein
MNEAPRFYLLSRLMQLARLATFLESDEFTSRLGAAAAVARSAGGAAAGAPPAAPGVPTPAQPVPTAVNQKIVKNIFVMALLANPLLCVRGPKNTGFSELVNIAGSAPPFATALVLELCQKWQTISPRLSEAAAG